MAQKHTNITVIGIGLSVLYAISIWNYLAVFNAPGFRFHSAFISLSFADALIAAIAVIFLKEWGRLVLVITNAFLCFYFLYLFCVNSPYIEPSYIFMNIAVVLFFEQASIKLLFKSTIDFDRKSILVVDDDLGIQKTLKRILLPSGYSVLTANTGEKGLQVATLQKPDLIILDVILPGIKGRDVCARLKEDEETKNIPVIFLTSKNSPDDVKAELAAGGLTHLTKPVNSRVLLSEIKKIFK